MLVIAFAAGCGEDDEHSASSPVASTELTITLDPDGTGGPGAAPPLEAEFSCPGANAPRTACEAIDELPDDAADPIPPSTPCTEIYGGPDVVKIEGTIEDEPIDAELTRVNGCEIERFDRFLPLLHVLFPDYEPGAAIGP